MLLGRTLTVGAGNSQARKQLIASKKSDKNDAISEELCASFIPTNST